MKPEIEQVLEETLQYNAKQIDKLLDLGVKPAFIEIALYAHIKKEARKERD
jgi:S-adenosylmethionine synthetase